MPVRPVVRYRMAKTRRYCVTFSSSVPDGEDEKVTQFGFRVGDVSKARSDAERLTELGPEAEGGVPRTGGFDGVGPVGD